MPASRRKILARYAGGAVLGLAILLIAAFLFAWSGVYSVAASRGHWAITDWFLAFVMRNSVETHAWPIAAPPLHDRHLVRLGAAHFHGGCAFCHGAPGVPANPVTHRMLPPPPDLAVVARHWKERELFWIVKHGIKYAGMPAWVSQQRDDEVWAVVAFLGRLPGLDAQAYADLALGDVQPERQSGEELAMEETAREATGACARCHGAGGRGPLSRLVPILHGQPAEYLEAALLGYASGLKQSGIMQPIATALSPAAMKRLAGYYAGLAPPEPVDRVDPASRDLSMGESIAVSGVPEAEIPPCLSCHGPGALPIYPRLAGQNAAYLAGQLRLWRAGPHRTTPTAAIMAPIGRRLSDEQIDQVSAYLSALPRASGPEPPAP